MIAARNFHIAESVTSSIMMPDHDINTRGDLASEGRLPLMLLPGMMCVVRLWSDIPERVAAACCLVIQPALHLESSVEALAVRNLDSAPPRFSIAGLSMGGIVALEICRLAPGRVARLALLNTNARPDAPGKSELRARQIEQVHKGGLARVIRDELKPTYPSASRDHDLELKALIMDMAMKLGSEAFVQQSLALANRNGSLGYLQEIRCPVLVVCGEDDSLCPLEYHEEIVDRIPQARLEILPHCGHLSSLEHPALVAGLMHAWLREPAPQDQNTHSIKEASTHG